MKSFFAALNYLDFYLVSAQYVLEYSVLVKAEIQYIEEREHDKV